jgi:predicted acyl esterase
MIGGWRDGYMNPPLRLYESLNVPCKVMIGPWNHAMPDTAIPGPRIDYLREVVRWLDYWCKGKDTGIMDEPPITVYMQEYQPPEPDRLESAGAWRAETDWPPPNAKETTLYLGDNHTLTETPAAADSSDSFEYSPTVGLTGGLWSAGIQFGLPGDQRPDEALSMVYSTPPLKEDLHILGYPQVALHVSSSASVIGFVVSLCDVAPDGTSYLVAKGALNATRRESLSNPQPLTPGQIYKLAIPVDCTGWVFKKGHRIRLNIASADWPNLWPTPEPAINHVYRGPNHLSKLLLPTVPARSSATSPRFQPSTKQVGKHTSAVNRPTWKIIRDVLTDETTVQLSFSSKQRVNDTIVFENESTSKFYVDPHDPAQAGAQGRYTFCITRPQHKTASSVDVVVQATATHFHLTIDLDVQVNDTSHFTRHWTESIPRQYL